MRDFENMNLNELKDYIGELKNEKNNPILMLKGLLDLQENLSDKSRYKFSYDGIKESLDTTNMNIDYRYHYSKFGILACAMNACLKLIRESGGTISCNGSIFVFDYDSNGIFISHDGVKLNLGVKKVISDVLSSKDEEVSFTDIIALMESEIPNIDVNVNKQKAKYDRKVIRFTLIDILQSDKIHNMNECHYDVLSQMIYILNVTASLAMSDSKYKFTYSVKGGKTVISVN